MTKDEALKLALDELIHASSYCNTYDAIDVIRETLAQPEQDADRFCDANCVWTNHHPDCKLAQPEQEPLAVWELQEDGWDTICDGDWLETLPIGTKLYTTPPKREWVGLTDAEAQWLYDNCRTPANLIDMTEAKLKEKNT